VFSSTKTRFHEIRLRLEHHVSASPRTAFFWELFLFVFKQAWACLFGALILSLLLLTRSWPPHSLLSRYDFLFLAAITMQALLLILRMESIREAQVILIFHIVGTAMELFKTSVGSWTYPEQSFFRIGHVPLFSGFMYSSVGSYIARVTRIFDQRYTRYPSLYATVPLAVLIYINFFTHHFIHDLRPVLFLGVAAAFGPTWVYYRPYQKFRRMPLLFGFMLVSLFIWTAENIGTFATIWVYPHQRNRWHLVHFGKYGSWFLLMIISFILVSLVHPARSPEPEDIPSSALADA
jgi:uncharacterized membrane protein YoaT (DUF817 family)